MPPAKKKKKVDYEALNSPFTRIPHIDVATARDLLDLGFNEVHELAGRAPEVLFGSLKDLRPDTPNDRLFNLRLAVYYAETPEPDHARLHPLAWVD